MARSGTATLVADDFYVQNSEYMQSISALRQCQRSQNPGVSLSSEYKLWLRFVDSKPPTRGIDKRTPVEPK